jgi:hypothetical protein
MLDAARSLALDLWPLNVWLMPRDHVLSSPSASLAQFAPRFLIHFLPAHAPEEDAIAASILASSPGIPVVAISPSTTPDAKAAVPFQLYSPMREAMLGRLHALISPQTPAAPPVTFTPAAVCLVTDPLDLTCAAQILSNALFEHGISSCVAWSADQLEVALQSPRLLAAVVVRPVLSGDDGERMRALLLDCKCNTVRISAEGEASMPYVDASKSVEPLLARLGLKSCAHLARGYSAFESDWAPKAREFCPGTCTRALDEIRAAVLQAPVTPAVVAVLGAHGTGKSVMMAELARRGSARVANLLQGGSASACPYLVGGAHFFNYSDPGSRSTKTALLSLAVQLRASLPGFELPEDAQLQAAPGPAVLLEMVVLKPARDMRRKEGKPVVIVLDALDECAEAEELAMAIQASWTGGAWSAAGGR